MDRITRKDSIISLIFILLSSCFIQAQAPIEKVGEQLQKSLLGRLDLADLYVNDSVYYFGQFKIDVNNKGEITAYAFSDNVPAMVYQKFLRFKNHNKRRLNVVDSLVRASKYKNCSLIFPVRIAPDFIVQMIPVEVVKDKGFQKFEGKYLEGRLFYGQTLYLGITTSSISKHDEQ